MIRTCEEVQRIQIPRPFYPPSSGIPAKQKLYAFADASDLATCYVIYLRTLTSTGEIFVSIVCGSTKVLPKDTKYKGELSIPRAELIAAHDLAAKVLEVDNELDIENLEPTQYFTDSRVVLSYI